MEGLFTLDNFITLGMLTLLQAVLGLDNLLYISLESKRAPEDQQKRVRTLGIGLAIVLRIILLFVLIRVIAYFQDPIFGFEFSAAEGHFNLHGIIVLLGGIFIMYTAVKEIWHMLNLEESHEGEETKIKSINMIIASIVVMNLVFSFDSILSAMALTDVFWVMATAIIIGGVLMIYLAGKVSEFLKKNRMYEVLGLFILFIVGIMLLSEGGHLAHLKLFGNEVTPMSKTTFYFVIVVLVVIDIVQSKYQKKLSRK
jgi:predicted tellurium resistance membrane protein TerC